MAESQELASRIKAAYLAGEKDEVWMDEIFYRIALRREVSARMREKRLPPTFRERHARALLAACGALGFIFWLALVAFLVWIVANH